MKKSIFTILAILVAAVFTLAQAQTVDEILGKHFKAVGQEKLMDAKSFSIKGKVSQMGMEMPMEMKVNKSGEFLVTIEMQGQKMIQAFDGEKGWMIAPWMSADPMDLTGDQLEQAKGQANLEGELYDYQKKGSTAEFKGKVNLDGKDSYRIRLTTSDGNEKDYFIDANSYYITKVKTTISAQGQTVDIEQIMSDNKTIDGVTMPMKIESKSPMGSTVIITDEIKFNENFDPSLFKQPSK